MEAPEGRRIERHAVELISRVLNARPVVAFVGAGTSMAYGRLSWRDAVMHMQTSSLIIESEPRADFGALHRDLDVIEDYAVAMGMVRMQCEVDLTRTELYRRGGDLKAAARIASRGLTIATSNGLRLRKTSFLLHLATIAHAQGRTHECRPLLQEAFEIARDTEHHRARARGQKLWAQIATTSTLFRLVDSPAGYVGARKNRVGPGVGPLLQFRRR